MNEDKDTKTTTDQRQIKQWITERKGRPTVVKSTKDKKGSGLLRIDFGQTNEALEEISWDEFFRILDESRLAFLYQEHTKDGEISRFFKFVNRQE